MIRVVTNSMMQIRVMASGRLGGIALSISLANLVVGEGRYFRVKPKRPDEFPGLGHLTEDNEPDTKVSGSLSLRRR
jgi:hypothetical protein